MIKRICTRCNNRCTCETLIIIIIRQILHHASWTFIRNPIHYNRTHQCTSHKRIITCTSKVRWVSIKSKRISCNCGIDLCNVSRNFINTNKIHILIQCILSFLFIAACTATVSKPITSTATIHGSASANERTLRASHTPTIKWRTTQRHWIQSSINNWMHVNEWRIHPPCVINTPKWSDTKKTNSTPMALNWVGRFLRADLWLLLFINWKENNLY